LVTVAAWAIGGGLVSLKLPTLGSRGEMAEGGLTDDPGISAMSETRLEAERTVVPAAAVSPLPPPDDIEEAVTNLSEAFATSAQTPHAEPIPLIGLSDASLPDKLPTRHSFRTTAQPENQSTGRAEASRVSDGGSTAVSGAASSLPAPRRQARAPPPSLLPTPPAAEQV
jgi:hypothetical protein